MRRASTASAVFVFPYGFALALALIAAVPGAFAQGGSAVITLVMPPPGGEGYTALQSGASLPQGAASMYYNPALLSDLERSTGSQIFFTSSRQTLLPVLNLDDLTHEFQGFAAVAPDPEGGTDMAIGVFRNHVNFGENSGTDESGAVRRFNSSETVYGLGTAIRLGIPVSVGATAKYYESHLADGIGGVEPGIGWAFDLGLLVNPRILPPIADFAAASFTPSLGLAVKNLGPDVFYKEAWQSDPIPRTYTAALGMKLDAFDMLELEWERSLDEERVRSDAKWDPVRVTGVSGMFLIYRMSVGWLEDESGHRSETHVSQTLEFDMLRLHRMLRRISLTDYASAPRAMDAGYPFRKTRVWGIPFRANPRLAIGTRKIQSHDGGIRDGQRAFSLAFSL
jgi:hypothetical protein